ncbi:MAG: diaminopimelate epimerase [Dysgonamonadaceae bacterium]|jgi:diaminopimelate epimerase|nr:diaminopimelate epimerase [Dysgonamonadaceae bacterium]
MKFTKMHGTGNDYVYINCFERKIDNPSELSIKLSERHKGIGSDGLVLIMPSLTCDFRMRMFNADGTESQMCGNASRCVGKYVYDNKLTKKTVITLETQSGIKTLDLFVIDSKVIKVTVDMGEPVIDTAQIPVIWKENKLIGQAINFPSGKYTVTCVSMGNPHAVIFTKDSIDKLNLEKIGPSFEHHTMFPERINTEFVEILSPSFARMRVWERGSGETLACGTGACAVAVAGVLNGLLERKATISLRGGNLQIEWNVEDNHVYMTGETVTVFEGELI